MTAVAELFSARIHHAREQRGWSVSELARKAGVPLGTVKDLGRGRQGPTWVTAVAVAGALEISLDTLAAPSPCPCCDGMVKAGFFCPECGRGMPDGEQP